MEVSADSIRSRPSQAVGLARTVCATVIGWRTPGGWMCIDFLLFSKAAHPACGFSSLLCSKVQFRAFSGSFPSSMTRMHLALLITVSIETLILLLIHRLSWKGSGITLVSHLKGKLRQGKCRALLKAKFHPCIANGKHRDHCPLPAVLRAPLLCWLYLVCSGGHTEFSWRCRVNLLAIQTHFHTLLHSDMGGIAICCIVQVATRGTIVSFITDIFQRHYKEPVATIMEILPVFLSPLKNLKQCLLWKVLHK